MLLHVSSSRDYADFLDSQKNVLSFSDLKRMSKDKKIKSAVWRLRKLDFDPARGLLLSLYSQSRGRPAHDPLIFLRSFILMLRLGYSSVDNWVSSIQADPVLQYALGSWTVPGVASHYDFINRIMKIDPRMDELYPKGKFSKAVREKLKKNEKWINYDEGDTAALKEKYKNGAESDRGRASYAIEKLFDLAAVSRSQQLGLIPYEGLILSADGSCKHIHASPFGHKVKNPADEDHSYRYSAPDADIGWDSDLGVWYLGFTMYNISCHDAARGFDLPVFLTMRPASQHDALTSISATAQMLDMNPDLSPKYMAFDSASDSIHIYEYLRNNNIIPAIDWNKRTSGSKNPYAQYEGLNEKGIPVCARGIEMVRDGYDYAKMATKYRCPLAMGRISECPFWGKCSKSPYGRVVKTCDKTNMKLFGPLPYRSDKWKEIYKNRTSTERVNNRILNDYGLHSLTCRNGSKNFFFMIMAGINIHMDVWAKYAKD